MTLLFNKSLHIYGLEIVYNCFYSRGCPSKRKKKIQSVKEIKKGSSNYIASVFTLFRVDQIRWFVIDSIIINIPKHKIYIIPVSVSPLNSNSWLSYRVITYKTFKYHIFYFSDVTYWQLVFSVYIPEPLYVVEYKPCQRYDHKHYERYAYKQYGSSEK